MNAVTDYPDTPAEFVHMEGDWSYRDNGTPLCKLIKFRSKSQSTIQTFSLCGYKDGTIAIGIKVAPYEKRDQSASELFCKFLAANQVPVSNDVDWHGCINTVLPEAIKIVFRILADNNQIPDSHRDQLERIVAEGRCEPW